MKNYFIAPEDNPMCNLMCNPKVETKKLPCHTGVQSNGQSFLSLLALRYTA